MKRWKDRSFKFKGRIIGFFIGTIPLLIILLWFLSAFIPGNEESIMGLILLSFLLIPFIVICLISCSIVGGVTYQRTERLSKAIVYPGIALAILAGLLIFIISRLDFTIGF